MLNFRALFMRNNSSIEYGQNEGKTELTVSFIVAICLISIYKARISPKEFALFSCPPNVILLYYYNT